MPTAAELITKIEVHGVDQYARDMDKADKTTASAASNMDKAGKSAGGMGAAIGGATKALGAIGLAGMGISTVAGAAKGLGDALGLGLANQMEQTRAQMMAFYKDGAQVETLLGQVKKEAASTPFAFHEIAGAFAQLGPTAKAAGKDTLELTRVAEALAASNPMQGFEGAVFALKEAVSGDMASIIDRFNLSRSSIKKFRDQGMTDLEAVQAAMAEQGITYDLVAAQAQTMSGRWSTFTDTINEVKMAIATPIFEALKSSLIGMQGGLESALPRLREFGQIAGEGIARGIELLGEAIRKAGPAVAGFISADVIPKIQQFADILISPVIPAVQQFASVVADQLGPPLIRVLGFIGEHQEILGGLAAVVGGVLVVSFTAWAVAAGAAAVATIAAAAPVIALGVALAALAAGIIYVVKNWDEITARFPALGAAAEIVQGALDALGGKLSEFGQTILPELSAAWQATADNVGTIIGGVQAAVEAVFGAIQGFLQAHSTEINTIIQGAWAAIETIITTATGAISNTIQFWLNVFQGDWDAAWQNVKNIVQIIWDGITSLIQIAINTIPSIITLGMAAVQAVVEGAWNLIKSTVDNAINGENGVVAIMRAMPGAILAALSGLGSLLTGLGADLISGFMNGVNSRWNDAINFVRSLFEAAIGAVKDFLRFGEGSSGLGMDIGRDFIEGVMHGAGELGPALKDFVVNLAKEAFEGLKDTVGGALGAIGGAIGDVAGGAGGALGGVLGIGGGSGGGDTVPIERTTADGRIGYAPGAVTLSESQVRDLVNQAMAITGIQMSAAEYEGYINRLRNESGFNTGVVNLWDVNARNGTPSIGIGQTIGPTFRGNALPGYGDILNPLHNIIASLRYIRRRYPGGAPPPLPGVPYAQGGTVQPGWFTVGERGFELGHLGSDGLRIFSNEQSKALLSGMSGGARVPGFAAGTNPATAPAKSNMRLAEAASFLAAYGPITPELARALAEITQMQMDYFSQQAEYLEGVLSDKVGRAIAAELRRFLDWAVTNNKQYILSVADEQGPEAAYEAYHGAGAIDRLWAKYRGTRGDPFTAAVMGAYGITGIASREADYVQRFAQGGYIAEPHALVNLRTGQLTGTMSEAGGEWISPRPPGSGSSGMPDVMGSESLMYRTYDATMFRVEQAIRQLGDRIERMRVLMDGQDVGQIVTPHVSQGIAAAVTSTAGGPY